MQAVGVTHISAESLPEMHPCWLRMCYLTGRRLHHFPPGESGSYLIIGNGMGHREGFLTSVARVTI